MITYDHTCYINIYIYGISYLYHTLLYTMTGWWFQPLENISQLGRIIPYIFMFQTTNQIHHYTQWIMFLVGTTDQPENARCVLRASSRSSSILVTFESNSASYCRSAAICTCGRGWGLEEGWKLEKCLACKMWKPGEQPGENHVKTMWKPCFVCDLHVFSSDLQWSNPRVLLSPRTTMASILQTFDHPGISAMFETAFLGYVGPFWAVGSVEMWDWD